MSQIASLTLFQNDEARPIIEAILADNPGIKLLQLTGAVKLDREKEIVVRRASVEERLGRQWDLQEIQMVIISMAGRVDEDDDAFRVGWFH